MSRTTVSGKSFSTRKMWSRAIYTQSNTLRASNSYMSLRHERISSTSHTGLREKSSSRIIQGRPCLAMSSQAFLWLAKHPIAPWVLISLCNLRYLPIWNKTCLGTIGFSESKTLDLRASTASSKWHLIEKGSSCFWMLDTRLSLSLTVITRASSILFI
jgi:hypothetical protein